MLGILERVRRSVRPEHSKGKRKWQGMKSGDQCRSLQAIREFHFYSTEGEKTLTQ